jgi:hypothetical protein
VSDLRHRLAAIAGREFLPAARDLRQTMKRIDRRRREERARCLRRLRTAEQVGACVTLTAAIVAALFPGA